MYRVIDCHDTDFGNNWLTSCGGTTPSYNPYIGHLEALLPKQIGEFTLKKVDNVGSEPGSDKVEFGAADAIKAYYRRGDDPSAAVIKIFNFTSVEKPVEILQKQIGVFNDRKITWEVQDKTTKGAVGKRLVTRGGSMWTNGSLLCVLSMDPKDVNQRAFEAGLPF